MQKIVYFPIILELDSMGHLDISLSINGEPVITCMTKHTSLLYMFWVSQKYGIKELVKGIEIHQGTPKS